MTRITLLITMLLAGLGITAAAQHASAAGEDFLVNSQKNVLTIFKHQTGDLPFLIDGATFLITPNPFSHTAATNSTDYDFEFGADALLITDNDPLDSDPTEGIVELVGINVGEYSIIEVTGPAGFIANEEPAFAEVMNATSMSAEMFSIASTVLQESTVPPPAVNATALASLQSFAATVNGVQLSPDNLPLAVITNSSQTAASAPKPVMLANAINGQQDAATLFNTLGIPTYQAPSETSVASNSRFYVPPFIAPDSSAGGKLAFTPKLDNAFRGLTVSMDLRDQDVGVTKTKVDSINIPIGVEGQDVGFKVKFQDTIPPVFPGSPHGETALFLSIDTTGTIDFGNSASFASPATVTFKVKRTLNIAQLGDGCPDARVYLLDRTTNTWQIQAAPARNPPGDDSFMCSYTQMLPHFSEYVVAGNNGLVPGTGGHGGHGTGGGGGGGSGGHSYSSGGSPLTSPDLSSPGALSSVQLGKVSLQSLQGAGLATINAGQQVSVASQMHNGGSLHQPYAFIVQVLDEKGFTASLSWAEGHLDPGQTITQSRSWRPESAGKYRIEVMVWDGLGSKVAPLSEKASMAVNVGPAS
jgi:hypothetical protein